MASFQIYSLRSISRPATALYRPQLNAAFADVQRKTAGRVDISHNAVCVTTDAVEGANVVPHNLALVNERVVQFFPHMAGMIILHECLHISLAENRLFPVRERFSDIWRGARSALENSFEWPNNNLVNKPIYDSFAVGDSSPWYGNRIAMSVIRGLATPERVSQFMDADLNDADRMILEADSEIDKNYLRFFALERANLIFTDFNALSSWTEIFFEEAFVNVMTPWLLGMDFEEALYAFKLDRGKIELSQKLYSMFKGRESELLQAFKLKGNQLIAYFSGLLTDVRNQ